MHQAQVYVDAKVTDTDKQIIITNVHQASIFIHLSQISVDYIFVALLIVFFIAAVNYCFYKPIVPLPPWYIINRYYARLKLSAWKSSNLLYRSSLIYL